MLKKTVTKPYILLIFLFFLYACPQAIQYKYKEIKDTSDIHKNSIIKYKNDSIEVYLSYIHFFGNKKRNILIANLFFLTDKTILKNEYDIEITSLKFGVLKKEKNTSDSLAINPNYSNLKRQIPASNVFSFQKKVGTKNSLRKIKKDTINLVINKLMYSFKISNRN